MNDAERIAQWLESRPSLYVGVSQAAALLRSQAAEIEGWKADQKENLRNQCDLHAEIERLKAESNEMALIGVRSVADVLELRAENEQLRESLADFASAAVSLQRQVESPKQEQAEPVAWMTEKGDVYNVEQCGNVIDPSHTPLYTAPKGQTELLRQAMEALEHSFMKDDKFDKMNASITAIKQHLGEAT